MSEAQIGQELIVVGGEEAASVASGRGFFLPFVSSESRAAELWASGQKWAALGEVAHQTGKIVDHALREKGHKRPPTNGGGEVLLPGKKAKVIDYTAEGDPIVDMYEEDENNGRTGRYYDVAPAKPAAPTPSPRQIPLKCTPEIKYYDRGVVSSETAFVGSRYNKLRILDGLVNGTGIDQRLGNKIKILSVQYNGRMQWRPSAVDDTFPVNPAGDRYPGPFTRTLLVDKYSNFSTTLDETAIWSNPTDNFGRLRVPSHANRYKILKDDVFTCPNALSILEGQKPGTCGAVSDWVIDQFFLPMNMDVSMGTSSSTCLNNDLWLIFTKWHNYSTTGAQTNRYECWLKYNIRVRYLDI